MKRDRLGMRSSRVAIVVLGGALTASCSVYQPLDGGSGVPWAKGRSAADASATPDVVPGELYRVRSGDRLGLLAERFDVSVGELASANDLEAPYLIYVGQELRIPAAGTTLVAARDGYTVRRGDTLTAIARRYDVPITRLAGTNEIRPPYQIYAGQHLRIPPGEDAVAPATSNTEPVTVVAVAEAPATSSPEAAVTAAPPEPPPARPAPAATSPSSKAARPIAVATVTPGPASGGADGDVKGAIELVKGQGKPPPLSDDGFLWPVNGKVVGQFGPTGHGRRRDGIDIAARKGTPVLAAQDGVVAYAGEGIRGYGRMVLVRHADGYITTYAHNAALLVEVGDVVKRGEVIARVGDSGDATTSMLHFELRKGTEPIDPETRLVGGATAMAVGN